MHVMDAMPMPLAQGADGAHCDDEEVCCPCSIVLESWVVG